MPWALKDDMAPKSLVSNEEMVDISGHEGERVK